MDQEEKPGYLVRYGVMGHVGKFPLDPGVIITPVRGQTVVIRSTRGLELGEVLVAIGPEAASDSGAVFPPDGPMLLRSAGIEDLESYRGSEKLRFARFDHCRRIVDEARWPMELIDVEPLLQPDTVVLHCIGSKNLELATLRAGLRSRCDFDVLFEFSNSEPAAQPEPTGGESQRRCGDCDCGAGGCGTSATSATPVATEHSCGTVEHKGCASCGVSQWVAKQGRSKSVAEGTR